MISQVTSAYLRYSFIAQHVLDLCLLTSRFAQKVFLEMVDKKTSSEIKSKYQTLLKQYKIRKDLEIICQSYIHTGCAIGANYQFLNSPIIMMDASLVANNQSVCGFLFKHELSHVLYNDNFWLKTICLISTIACYAIMAYFGMHSGTIFLSEFVISYVSAIMYSRFYENRADEFAIQHSSHEELRAGMSVFKNLQKIHLTQRQDFITKWTYSNRGDNNLDLFHPSLSSRVMKLEKALRVKTCVPELAFL